MNPKTFTILLLFLLPSFSFLNAQNWDLIGENNQLNFKVETSDLLSTTIWIDSVKSTTTDTIYYLNRIAQQCSACPINPPGSLRNQGQFLGKQLNKSNGKYILETNPKTVLFPTAPENFSWLYDTLNNVSAQVLKIEEASIFGQMDSIKTILLSSSDTIKISKSFGILKFPSLTENDIYELVGIDNLGLGSTIPKFDEIYDFEVGDIFEFYYRSASGATFTFVDKTEKREIMSKTVSNDKVCYEIAYQEHVQFILNGSTPDTYYTAKTIEECYTDSASHGANVFNQELLLNVLPPEYTDQKDNWIVSFFYLDANGVFSKSLGDHENFYDGIFAVNSESDTLNYCCNNPIDYYRVYKVGLGETDYELHQFENTETYHLRGYIKGQDTIGVITPDSILQIPLGLEERQELQVKIFPNPTSEELVIELIDFSDPSSKISIQTISGRTVLQEELNSSLSNINVSNLPVGMYIVRIEQEGGIAIRKILKL